MQREITYLREFGNCRLDLEKKVLWHEQALVQLPLKAVELLCVLVESNGEIVTKEEIWRRVWQNSFVEETNLTHNIYLLRKTLKDLGAGDLIQNVPRRGYRFTGKLREIPDYPIVIERHSLSRTLIEIEEGNDKTNAAEEKKLALQNISSATTSPRHLSSISALIIASALLVALAGSLAIWRSQTAAAKTSAAEIKSIAVLPFKAINSNPETEHLGLSLADVLITRLSNVKQLNVRPTSAVSAFENQETDSLNIGQKLNVDAVLEGTIYRTEKQVRVTMRLLKVGENKPLWAGQFEKSWQDELKLENEIALQVTDALVLNLSSDEKNALGKRYTENADAYQLYLKGRYEWNKRSWEGMIEAERLFRNAIEKDPNFALAYVGLADRLATEADATEANQVIEKALELDPNLAEAHATQGFIKMFHEWNWPEAESSFKKSIKLNSGYATAHHWYATLLEIEGRNDEAKAELQRALEINPASYNFLADLGQIYYFSHDYDKAKEYCQKSLEIYPDFVFAHEYFFDIYLQTGEFDQAVEENLKLAKINATFANQTADQKERMEKSFAGMKEKYRKGGIRGFFAPAVETADLNPNVFYGNAKIYAFSGEKEKALDSLEKAFQGRAFALPFVKAEPVFDNLRAESRYQEILGKMNLQ
ncbi:MAG: FlgO family outer membrane protein [Pyrinomonadaceae bacterium]